MSQSKSNPNTYVVVTTCDGTDLRFLDTFTDPAAIGPYLTANSSGNQPFAGDVSSQPATRGSVGNGVASLAVGETNRSTFGAVTVHVTALRTDGRTKTIYVTKAGAAQTTKLADPALTLKYAPLFGDWEEESPHKNKQRESDSVS